MTKEIKIDTDLLDRLVIEFKKSIEDSYYLKQEMDSANRDKESYQAFMIEISKASGILLGLSQEITLLLGDLQKYVKNSCYSLPMTDTSTDNSFLEKLLQPIKGKNSN
jgi:hypothetical protein